MIIKASKFDQNSNSEIPLYFKYTLYIKYSMEREARKLLKMDLSRLII